jgi:hypothetical protein
LCVSTATPHAWKFASAGATPTSGRKAANQTETHGVSANSNLVVNVITST